MLLIGIPGGPELIIIALVLVLLFGGAKIPALMRGMGQGIREFRKEVRGPEENDRPASVGTSESSQAPKDGT